MVNLFETQELPIIKEDIERLENISGENCVENVVYIQDALGANKPCSETPIEAYKIGDKYYIGLDSSNNYDGCYIKFPSIYDIPTLKSWKLETEFKNTKNIQDFQQGIYNNINKTYFTNIYSKLPDIERIGDKDNYLDGAKIRSANDAKLLWPVYNTKSLTKLQKGTPFNKLIMYIIYSLISTITIAIISCTTEFWLIYGNSYDENSESQKRKSKIVISNDCKNIGDKFETKHCNLTEQLFRFRIWNYPYQHCNFKIGKKGNKYINTKDVAAKLLKEDADAARTPVGGAKMSNGKVEVKFNNTSDNICMITPDDQKPENENRPFPYNIADIADDFFQTEYPKIIPRNICYIILIMMLTYRYIVYKFIDNISRFYNTNIKNISIVTLILFFIYPGFIVSVFLFGTSLFPILGGFMYILFFLLQLFEFLTVCTKVISEGKMGGGGAVLFEIIFVCSICAIILYFFMVILRISGKYDG